MSYTSIDAELLSRMILAGAGNLEAKKEWINGLNVFPVPDGDTGTNMTLTISSAVREMNNISRLNMESLAKAVSSGSLRGARGNSGVILSQLFRGFSREIQDKEELTTVILAQACNRAQETAYKAVMKPKEGTILTVARCISEKALEIAEGTPDVETFMDVLIHYGDEVLEQTPEMLPVLKEAGVVDSGGQGLMQVLKGAYDCLTGKVSVDLPKEGATFSAAEYYASEDEEDIEFGYCTEFIINLEKAFMPDDKENFREYLESLGNSLVLVDDEDIVKVHVHTNDPGLAISRALTYGSLSSIKIDNMREEHRETLIKKADRERAQAQAQVKKAKQHKVNGFIAVSRGAGLADILRDLTVDEIIEGGQTMNPSTEDILEAVKKVDADNVYILPNNKNIVLAANQAAMLTEDKNVIVVPSASIPQGIAAMISFVEESSPEENLEMMKEAMDAVAVGEITYAVRDTVIDGKEIAENNIIGIVSGAGLAAVGEEINDVAWKTLSSMLDEDSELVSIYFGEDIPEDQANALGALVEEAYPMTDVEIHYGGQPIYYYILSVE